MGNDESRRRSPDGAAHHRRFSHGLLTVAHRLRRRVSHTEQLPITRASSSSEHSKIHSSSRDPHKTHSSSTDPHKTHSSSTDPHKTHSSSREPHKTHSSSTDLSKTHSAVSPFLPEFPLRKFPGQNQFQVLGFIAKGSFGPILKLKDVSIDKTYAVKVLPKAAILRHEGLDQSKEEVIIQRQLKHPFIHHLQDCWQTQHHLFIMCDYCGVGDLHTCWLLQGRFEEDDIRFFAAEMANALGFMHDLGIMHRDMKMDNILLSDHGHLRLTDFGLSRRLKRGGRAFTICGTMQYMAPEVLGGGPYNHAADWWSLGVMLYCLATGEFPVPPESGHIAMLNKVRQCPYAIPNICSTALTVLLTELLSKNPANRLRNLDSFQMQAFFRGTSFDSEILQKSPMEVILKLRAHPDWSTKAMRGLTVDYLKSFDCHKVNSPAYLSQGASSLAKKDVEL